MRFPPDPGQTAREFACLTRNLPRPQITTVLELCCVYGRHAALLAAEGYDVPGIDRDESVIELARSTHTHDLQTLRILDMKLLHELPERFDAVICMWQSFGYFDTATNAAGADDRAERKGRHAERRPAGQRFRPT